MTESQLTGRDDQQTGHAEWQSSVTDESGTPLSSFTDLDTLPLAYHTVRNMTLEQLLGVATRELRQAVVPRLPVDFDARYERRVPASISASPAPLRDNTTTLRGAVRPADQRRYRDRANALADGRVTFLNHTIDVTESDGVAWTGERISEPPLLWAMQFHGFEFLRWPVFGFDSPRACPDVHETVRSWVGDWADSEETAIGGARYLRGCWTPHAVSLRLLNWSRYYAWCAPEEERTAFGETLRRLLYKNALFLANHVEYDLGGNHLVENGAALAAVGLLLDGGDQWLRQGLAVLTDATDQFLADGGHFERSPMYHILTLTRYLTIIDLLRRSGRDPPAALVETAAAATGFLTTLRPPDDHMPLLNDAVADEALPLECCLDYATDVGIAPATRGEAAPPTASGYYWLGSGPDRMLVDGGAIGPPHLPAHSHNDHLAVLFWADGDQLLADTGTYEYAPTARREYARSVAAHNTVQVGDTEPIDTGGSFLMGRRIDPTVAAGQSGDIESVAGEYRKQSVRGTRYRHRRRVYAGDDWWFVDDDVTADAPRQVRSRLHCHPQVTVTVADDRGQVSLSVGEEHRATLTPVGVSEVSVSTSPYYPAFGREMSRPLVTLSERGARTRFGFLLACRPHGAVAVERADGVPAVLELDDRRVRLPTDPLAARTERGDDDD